MAGMYSASAGHVGCHNVANAGLYLLNVLVFVLAYFDQLPGLGSPAETLFSLYPTLITPGEVALRIVPVIFAFEGVFIFFQLLPIFRSNHLVQLITPWWVGISLLQIQWVVDLGRNTPGSIAYALGCCLAMLAIVLGMILVVDAKKPTFWEFWFLRAPFSFHAGWLIVASAVNINVWATSVTSPAFGQSELFAIAMVSLSMIFILTALWSINTRRPDPLICVPVAWCLYWVWLDKSSKPTTMPQEMVFSTEIACAHCYTGVLALGVMAMFLRVSMACVSNKIPQAYEEGGVELATVSVIL